MILLLSQGQGEVGVEGVVFTKGAEYHGSCGDVGCTFTWLLDE